MSKETKKTAMKKVAVKTVIANCREDLQEVKTVKALLATLFKKADKEWIPKIAKTEAEAKDLLKKALEISVNDGEDGTMDVAVSSEEGEAVSVQDNTNAGASDGFAPEGGEDFGAEGGVEGAPMDDAEMQKTFKLMKAQFDRLEKSIEKKKTK